MINKAICHAGAKQDDNQLVSVFNKTGILLDPDPAPVFCAVECNDGVVACKITDFALQNVSDIIYPVRNRCWTGDKIGLFQSSHK